MKRINIYKIYQMKESSQLYDIENIVVNNNHVAIDVIEKVFNLSQEDTEHLGILTLNTKHKITGAHIVSIGGLDHATCVPREIFKLAILNNAVAIILFHNHPSGDPQPSTEDIKFTKLNKEAANLLGIKLLDHLIVGENGVYVSLLQLGHL